MARKQSVLLLLFSCCLYCTNALYGDKLVSSRVEGGIDNAEISRIVSDLFQKHIGREIKLSLYKIVPKTHASVSRAEDKPVDNGAVSNRNRISNEIVIKPLHRNTNVDTDYKEVDKSEIGNQSEMQEDEKYDKKNLNLGELFPNEWRGPEVLSEVVSKRTRPHVFSRKSNEFDSQSKGDWEVEPGDVYVLKIKKSNASAVAPVTAGNPAELDYSGERYLVPENHSVIWFESMKTRVETPKPTKLPPRASLSTSRRPTTVLRPQGMTSEAPSDPDGEYANHRFSSHQLDEVNPPHDDKEEIKDRNTVTGSYSYNGGQLNRTVHYAADEKGYNITRELSAPILSQGPEVDPEGTVQVSPDENGRSYQDTIPGQGILKRKRRTRMKKVLMQRTRS